MKRTVVLLLSLFALLTSSFGCELLAVVDRSQIPDTGGAGGASTTSSTGGGGSGGAGGGPCVPVDDGNACTDDVCTDGLPVHTPTVAGTPCSMGGVLCDGKGACVECLSPSDCSGTDGACQTRTCDQGTCGMDFMPAGTVVAAQMLGNCKKDVCDGNGAVVSENDDADVPDDKNNCTDDLCSAGLPSHKALPKGTVCGADLVCDGAGFCTGCNVPTDCPGTDDECKTRTCVNTVCGAQFTQAGTAVAMQTAGDCLVSACDGNGNTTDQVDDGDLPPDDGNACTSEVCTAGMSSHPDKANGAACNDGDGCTLIDTCQAGVCTSGAPLVCPAPDQCHDAGVCDPATGVCSNPSKANGVACNDGNGCTQNDTCQAGVCTSGAPLVCPAPDQCHDAGACNPATGVCSNPNKANGAACNDGDSCTQNDTCQAGVCTSGAPLVCPAPDQCHDAGACNPATGVCSNPNKANGAACNDGDSCTQNDTCQAGVCTSGAPLVCPAPDQCHTAGVCNPATGVCSNPNKANGAACTDGDSCTQSDTCQAGVCTAGAPLVCPAPDQCHDAGACNPATGVCSNPSKANGAACSDGNGCTQSDTCQAGVCTSGAPLVCPAPDQCHDAGICDMGTGACSNPPKANGSACSDGDGCTQTDTCQAGICTGGSPVTCAFGALCSAGSCIYDPIAYVKASNTGSSDQFSYSVALSADGNTLAVGALVEDSNATGIDGNQSDNSTNGAGAVYVFTRNGGVWSQQAYIKASNPGANDNFGNSVALSADGNTLAVGAAGEASNATGIDGNQNDDSAPTAGAVYVFTRSGGVWSQQAYVKASNAGSFDGFGFSVALSADGNTLAVGAYAEDGNATGINGNQNDTSLDTGAVYVFTRSGGVWSQQAYVKASNTDSDDQFGWSVALSADGNTLAVGAYAEDSNATSINGDQNNNSANSAGAVYVFTRSGGVWSQQAYVKASNSGVNDQFGWSVALSADGNTLAVGAWLEDSNATGIDGNQSDNSAASSGAAYVFALSGGVWSQQAYVKASNTASGDFFGRSVALSADGNTLAVSAYQEDSNATGINGDQNDNSAGGAGAVYMLKRSGGVWSQQAYVKASNPGANDNFGNSVALSADGNTLAVGAIGEDSNATGVGGDQNDNSVGSAGAVYVY